jgi:hypothetical protein
MPQLQYPILKMADGMVHKTLTAFSISPGTNLKKLSLNTPHFSYDCGRDKNDNQKTLSLCILTHASLKRDFIKLLTTSGDWLN